MRDQVNYYLDRARAAALAGTLGTLTEVEPVIAGLTRTFAKIYRDKDLAIDMTIPPACAFAASGRISRRWPATSSTTPPNGRPAEVLVEADREPRATPSARALVLIIDDDGPGLPEAGRVEMLKRGRRLDETKPGSGLGLSIVSDLAALYGGTLRLDVSSLGGLRAVLELPGGQN